MEKERDWHLFKAHMQTFRIPILASWKKSTAEFFFKKGESFFLGSGWTLCCQPPAVYGMSLGCWECGFNSLFCLMQSKDINFSFPYTKCELGIGISQQWSCSTFCKIDPEADWLSSLVTWLDVGDRLKQLVWIWQRRDLIKLSSLTTSLLAILEWCSSSIFHEQMLKGLAPILSLNSGHFYMCSSGGESHWELL